jgi:hypothetical protein
VLSSGRCRLNRGTRYLDIHVNLGPSKYVKSKSLERNGESAALNCVPILRKPTKRPEGSTMAMFSGTESAVALAIAPSIIVNAWATEISDGEKVSELYVES